MFLSAGGGRPGHQVRRTTNHHTATPAGPGAATTVDPDRPAHEPGGLVGLVEQVAAVVAEVDAEVLASWPTEALRARVGLAHRLEGLAAVVLAQTARAMERAGGVREDGAPSVAAWVRAHTGRSGRDAARITRLAANLADLPQTAAGLASGAVSVEAADAVVQAARDTTLGSPDEVDATLAPLAATSTPEQLRREIRERTQTTDGSSQLTDERRQHQRRRLALTRRDDGMWDLYGLLPGEIGEAGRTALNAFDRPDPTDTPQAEKRRPDQRLADAFEAAIGALLDHGRLSADGGVARPHVSVIVDLHALEADLTDPDDPDRPVPPDHPAWASVPAGETGWGSLLSPQAARRMCCDASISRIVTAGASQVLDVGRATRVWTAPQRRAIVVRDRTCRGPACDRPIAWTEIHHLVWWRRDGETNLDNGLSLCHRCHRLVHDFGWHPELDPVTAAVTWTTPDRRRTVVVHPRPPG